MLSFYQPLCRCIIRLHNFYCGLEKQWTICELELRCNQWISTCKKADIRNRTERVEGKHLSTVTMIEQILLCLQANEKQMKWGKFFRSFVQHYENTGHRSDVNYVHVSKHRPALIECRKMSRFDAGQTWAFGNINIFTSRSGTISLSENTQDGERERNRVGRVGGQFIYDLLPTPQGSKRSKVKAQGGEIIGIGGCLCIQWCNMLHWSMLWSPAFCCALSYLCFVRGMWVVSAAVSLKCAVFSCNTWLVVCVSAQCVWIVLRWVVFVLHSVFAFCSLCTVYVAVFLLCYVWVVLCLHCVVYCLSCVMPTLNAVVWEVYWGCTAFVTVRCI